MPDNLSETSLELKWLLFEMHEAGYTQDAMAAYLGKGKKTINEMLKPLQDGKGRQMAEESSELLRELKAVKMLLILQAMALGCQQKHVAAALGVSDATLSRMLPKGLGKELAKVAERQFSTASEGR